MAVVSLVYQAIKTPSRVTALRQSATSRGQFAISANYADPSVMLQRAGAPGTFEAVQALR